MRKKEHDEFEHICLQIKSVAPFPPVINDLNFGWSVLDHNLDGQYGPICPSKIGDNEFKEYVPQFAIRIAYLTCFITTTTTT